MTTANNGTKDGTTTGANDGTTTNGGGGAPLRSGADSQGGDPYCPVYPDADGGYGYGLNAGTNDNF